MADHHWRRWPPRWLQTALVLRKSPVSGKKHEKGYPGTSQAGAFWFCFPPRSFSLHPETLLASFYLILQPRLRCCCALGQMGMQQTGLALLALAACVAFHPSEGEWGSGYLSLQWKEGLPSKDGARRSEVPPAVKGRNFQLSTWEWHTFQSLTSKRQFQKGTSFEQEYQ